MLLLLIIIIVIARSTMQIRMLISQHDLGESESLDNDETTRWTMIIANCSKCDGLGETRTIYIVAQA